MRPRTALIAAAALALIAPATARADIFAVTEGSAPAPRLDLDIVLLDASTGARIALPAAVNTTDDEFHPSVTPDGRRMVFERRNSAAGTIRIVEVDLTTGQTADLFNVFDVAASPPNSPSITADGATVLTGGAFQTVGGKPFPAVTLTDVRNFPTGPFPRTTYRTPQPATAAGQTAGAALSGGRLVFGQRPAGAYSQFTVAPFPAGVALTVSGGGTLALSEPALGAPGGTPTVLFTRNVVRSDGVILSGDIGFTPFGNIQLGLLPPIVNSLFDESRPAFTPDSRYIGFVRRGADGPFRLQVFDTQTQTMVTPGLGPSLGTAAASTIGNVSLYAREVFRLVKISDLDTISFDLAQASGVGIIVQRVVGHHRQLGRRVPTLRMVGRVPFGKFARGHGRVRWDRRVNGRRLKPGTYLVTPRAVTPSLQIRDLGTPKLIRVR